MEDLKARTGCHAWGNSRIAQYAISAKANSPKRKREPTAWRFNEIQEIIETYENNQARI